MSGNKRFLQNVVWRPFLYAARKLWLHLPASLRRLPPGRFYGKHVHSLVLRYSERKQNHSTFFLRNRPELELLRRLTDQRKRGVNLEVAVVACSKGAEVYSLAWAIRTARPDLHLNIHAIDISPEIVEFARRGIYALKNPARPDQGKTRRSERMEELTWNTWRDQGPQDNVSLFKLLTEREMEEMFDIEDGYAKVRPWLKEGITWHQGDAASEELIRLLGPQDIVVANRFLCHMGPADAQRCLRNIARLVKPSGHIFVSGVDLDVRTMVAREMGWNPVTDLIREIHEGDDSLTNAWPLEYWGIEPFTATRPHWMTRYASVFIAPESPKAAATFRTRRTPSRLSSP